MATTGAQFGEDAARRRAVAPDLNGPPIVVTDAEDRKKELKPVVSSLRHPPDRMPLSIWKLTGIIETSWRDRY